MGRAGVDSPGVDRAGEGTGVAVLGGQRCGQCCVGALCGQCCVGSVVWAVLCGQQCGVGSAVWAVLCGQRLWALQCGQRCMELDWCRGR